MKTFKAGQKVKFKQKTAYQYEYFLPSPINRNFDIDNKIIWLKLETAVRLLGELNAYGH